MSVSAGVDVEEIRSFQRLEQLHAEWAELFQRLAAPAPFQSPDWMVPWCRHLQQGELLVLAARSAGKLMGVLPLCIWTEPATRIRTLFLAATGVSDYLDGAFDPEHAGDAAKALFQRIHELQHEWDVCELHQVRPESPLLQQKLPSDWTDDVTAGERCPVLALPDSPERLKEVFPTHQWDKLEYYQRRARRSGTVTVDRATAENVENLFPEFLRLHNARIDMQNRRGTLRDPVVQQFHAEVASRVARAGLLRLYVLRIDGKAVAAFYGFKIGETIFFYLSGFDPAASQLSPGMLIVGHAIEQAVREGCTAFDFLRGQESYKYKWGANDTLTYQRTIRKAR